MMIGPNIHVITGIERGTRIDPAAFDGFQDAPMVGLAWLSRGYALRREAQGFPSLLGALLLLAEGVQRDGPRMMLRPDRGGCAMRPPPHGPLGNGSPKTTKERAYLG